MTIDNALFQTLRPIIDEEMNGQAESPSVDDPEGSFCRAVTACREKLDELGLDDILETLTSVITDVAPKKAKSFHAQLLVKRELETGQPESAVQHWCELAERIERPGADPRARPPADEEPAGSDPERNPHLPHRGHRPRGPNHGAASHL